MAKKVLFKVLFNVVWGSLTIAIVTALKYKHVPHFQFQNYKYNPRFVLETLRYLNTSIGRIQFKPNHLPCNDMIVILHFLWHT